MTHQQPFFLPARSQATSPRSAELALMLLGPSAAMSQLWAQIRRLAPHVRTLLLTGEADCGQHAVARLLLDLSSYPQRPFVELKASEAEVHLCRNANFSSLPSDPFLYVPDVHLLSPAAQEGLLSLMRLRRARPIAVVASTREDLRALVGMGRFSAELADALGAIRITLPPLRKRTEDMPMLLGQMLAARAANAEKPVPQITEDLLRTAMQHDWPGNLQELSSTVDKLLTVSEAESELGPEELQRALILVQAPAAPAPPPVRMVALDTVVQEHIFAVLRGCRGNKLRAAEVLGISRSTLYRMLDATTQDLPLSIAS